MFKMQMFQPVILYSTSPRSVKKFAIPATILGPFKIASAALYACSLAKKYGPQVQPANSGQGCAMNDALQHLQSQGYIIDCLPPDGILQRLPTANKPNSKNGWIIAYSDPATVLYGDWSQGEGYQTWSAKGENTMTPTEREALRQRMEQARLVREDEQKQRRTEAAQKAQQIYSNAPECHSHAYLERKSVSACQGIKLASDGRLIVPLHNQQGKIVSLQFIAGDGQKRFLTGGKKAGCFFPVGKEPGKPLLVCEGMATGLSLREATGNPVLVAFDCGNLMAVATIAREIYPQREIIVCADNDCQTEGNPGITAATAAAKAIGALIAIPPTHEGKPTDFNDLAAWRGLDAVRIAIESATQPQQETEEKQQLCCLNVADFLGQSFPPRDFLLRPILPRQGLAMLHAPRGIGKTYAALTVAYAVAIGGKAFDRWEAAQPARVLLIDGEMPAPSLQERIAALVAGNEQEPPSPEYLRILTPDMQPGAMPNLATTEGQRAVEPFVVDADLIIIDNLATLARAGRSNDEESWLPMQAWLLDLRRRGKTVLLVHHANKNGEQRGTSAKEDILDTSIKLRRPGDYEPEQGARFEIHLTKARGICGNEAKPFEAQLFTKGDCLQWIARDLADSELEQLAKLLGEGLSIRDCAEEMGTSKGKVQRLKKKLDERNNFAGTTFDVSPGGGLCAQ